MTTAANTSIPAPPYLRDNYDALCDDTLTPLQRLGAAKSVELNLESYTRTIALTARSQGASWQQIAEPLHITRQAAYARYGFGLPDD